MENYKPLTAEVKFKRMREGAVVPAYATPGSAALDLRACIEEKIVLAPGERALVPSGIAIDAGAGVVGIVCARSGMAIKRGLTLTNGIGVIDSDYRGEISVGIYNISGEEAFIEPGERIAQLLFMPVIAARPVEAAELEETERGAGGFGSTGSR